MNVSNTTKEVVDTITVTATLDDWRDVVCDLDYVVNEGSDLEPGSRDLRRHLKALM